MEGSKYKERKKKQGNASSIVMEIKEENGTFLRVCIRKCLE